MMAGKIWQLVERIKLVGSWHFGRIFLLLIAVVLFAFTTTQLTATENTSCSGTNLIDRNLPNNGRWELCWHHDSQRGIVLTDVIYSTPSDIRRKVLGEAALAQIHIPFDDNSARLHLLTDEGLGGENLLEIGSAECLNGQLLAYNGKNVLCVRLDYRGYLFKNYYNQAQGFVMQIFSVSQVGQQTFVVQWNFSDDGTIQPTIGATGQLAQLGRDTAHGWPLDDAGTVGIGHLNNYFWRLDFELAENGANEIVEEIDINPTLDRERKTMQITPLLTETARNHNADVKRSWRIKDAALVNADGHAISYHIVPSETAHRFTGPATEPFTHHDIFITRDEACETFASHNPTQAGCGDSVAAFVNGEGIDSADIVIWYSVSHHFLPSSEDQPYRNLQWSGFEIMPRDWTAESELAQ